MVFPFLTFLAQEHPQASILVAAGLGWLGWWIKERIKPSAPLHDNQTPRWFLWPMLAANLTLFAVLALQQAAL